MSNLTFNESVTLPSDRYQLYGATKHGRFKIMEAAQSLSPGIDRPNEIKDQIGDAQHRGMSLKQPVVAASLTRLLVDAEMPQYMSEKMGWVNVNPADQAGTSLSGTAKIFVKVVAPITSSGTYEIRAIAQDKVRIETSGGAVLLSSLPIGATGVVSNGVEVGIIDVSGLLYSNDTATFSVATYDHWDADADFKSSAIDLRLVVKDGTNNIFSTWYLPELAVLSDNVALTADGDATETLEMETEKFQKYDGYVLKRQVLVDATKMAANQFVFGQIYASESGIVIPQEHKTGSPYAGKHFIRVTKWTNAGVKTELTEVSGAVPTASQVKYDRRSDKLNFYQLTSGDRIEMTFYSLKSGSATESFSETFSNSPITIVGDYIPVSIGVDTFDRATALNINTALKRERKSFLGETDVKYSLGKVPDITGDVSSVDDDLELVRLLSKGSTTDTGTEYYAKEFSDYTNDNSIQLVANLRDPADNTTTVLKYTIPSIVVTNMKHDINVNSDTTRNFSWTNKLGTLDIDRHV